jgi:hypothetical protein
MFSPRLISKEKLNKSKMAINKNGNVKYINKEEIGGIPTTVDKIKIYKNDIEKLINEKTCQYI